MLLHAAAEVLPTDAALATRWATAALRWMADGRVYKVTRELVAEVGALLLQAGAAQGDEAAARAHLQAAGDRSRSPATRAWITAFLAGDLADDPR